MNKFQIFKLNFIRDIM